MSVAVSVHKVSHPRYSHRVRYPGPSGKIKQSWFTSETKAMAFAQKRRKEVGQEGRAFGTLASEERAAVEFWRGLVQENQSTPPPPLIEVLREFSDRWEATQKSVSVEIAYDAFISSKTAEGLRPISLQGLKTRCGRFARDFASRPISSITTSEISAWILGLKATSTAKNKKHGGPYEAAKEVGLLAKRNYRLALSNLFSFAKTRDWIIENPVTDAARPRPPKKRPGIISAKSVSLYMNALLQEAPEIVAFWALRFFAGIREQEILRMDWHMIDLGAGEIHLPDTVTKTGRDRTIKILPPLHAFLLGKDKLEGPIAPISQMSRRLAQKRAIDFLNSSPENHDPVFTLPPNVARHCFATYHLLAYRHAGETALQLGHGGSPEMLLRHYKGLASEKEAIAFWAILPTYNIYSEISPKTHISLQI